MFSAVYICDSRLVAKRILGDYFLEQENPLWRMAAAARHVEFAKEVEKRPYGEVEFSAEEIEEFLNK